MEKSTTFAARLKEILTIRGITASDLARMTGISRSSISHYVKGDWEGKQDAVYKIAHAVNCSEAWLMGYDARLERDDGSIGNVIPVPPMRKIPLLGTIACGAPINAEENYAGDVDTPANIHADFALKCKGDSMINARIFDGDICYIRRQPTVENGQIAAVLIDGEATLKRVKLYDNHISLEPENPLYRPLVYWDEDMAKVTILGLAVAFTSRII